MLTLVLVRDHRSLGGYTYTIGLVGLGFLLLPVVPKIGETINGARLWVRLGPISFQPSEAGKVLLVVFMASYLASHRDLLAVATRRIGPVRIPEPKYLGPLLIAWGVSLAVLFVEKDLGSSLLFFAIFVAMLWAGTGRASYLVLGIVLFAIAAVLGYLAFPTCKTAWRSGFTRSTPPTSRTAGFSRAGASRSRPVGSAARGSARATRG